MTYIQIVVLWCLNRYFWWFWVNVTTKPQFFNFRTWRNIEQMKIGPSLRFWFRVCKIWKFIIKKVKIMKLLLGMLKGYLKLVVYLCIIFSSMNSIFALPGWRCKCILKKEGVSRFGLVFGEGIETNNASEKVKKRGKTNFFFKNYVCTHFLTGQIRPCLLANS